MNEHEKLETALDLLESYAHGNGINRDLENPSKVTFWAHKDVVAATLLSKCGRFRITDVSCGGITGYWSDEDPERKAGK